MAGSKAAGGVMQGGLIGMSRLRRGRLLGIAAIALWAPAAVLVATAARIPALIAVGIAFCIGGTLVCLVVPPCALRDRRILWGTAGLLGSNLLYFHAMQWAAPAHATVINYSWPLILVLAAPLLVPGARWKGSSITAAAAGFAAVAWLLWDGTGVTAATVYGWLTALLGATVWATYSLVAARFPNDGRWLGPAMLLSGVTSLGLGLGLHGWPTPTGLEAGALLALGLGPTGLAFLCWNAALGQGDTQWLGVAANAVPIGATGLLAIFGFAEPTLRLAVAALGVVAATLAVNAGAYGSPEVAGCQDSERGRERSTVRRAVKTRSPWEP